MGFSICIHDGKGDADGTYTLDHLQLSPLVILAHVTIILSRSINIGVISHTHEVDTSRVNCCLQSLKRKQRSKREREIRLLPKQSK